MTESLSPTVSVQILAKLLNITERRVQQLSKQGIIARSRAGEYDLCRSLHGYTAYLQSLIAAPDCSNESAELQHERIRLVRAQADRAEYLYRVASREWVSLAVVEEALHEIGAALTGTMEGLPGRLAFELAGLSDPALIKARLFVACRELRRTLGECLVRLGKTFLQRDQVGADSACCTPSDTESVGE